MTKPHFGERLEIGSLRLSRLLEHCGPVVSPFALLPDLPKDSVERNMSWLVPHLYDPMTECLMLSTHGWLVRTRHFTVLVEACAGAFKNLPGFRRFHQVQYPWIETLHAAGARVEDIDFVMCTHFHANHVGWNTRLVDGRWVPTFPKAKYIMSRTEYDHWNPATRVVPDDPMQENMFQESILPVVEAGLAVMVDGGYEVDDGLVLEPAPGHTPGHCWIKAESEGEGGIFCGDILHSPLQVLHPHVNCRACEDPAQARATRMRLLQTCADAGWLALPAHLPGPYSAMSITRQGEDFGFAPAAHWSGI